MSRGSFYDGNVGEENLATTSEVQAANAAASATAAAASAAAALVSEGLADTDATATAADLVLTNADVVSTAADLVATNQDTIDTASDLVATNQDTIDTAADVVTTNADVVLTTADAAATALDKIATNADVVLTNADVVLTGLDVVSTAADVVTTNADVVLTGLDVVSTAADLVATNQDTIDTAADLVATNQDTIDTAADLVATNQDTIDTAADLVLTNADVVTTNADVVLTNADVVLAEAAKVAAELAADNVDDTYLGAKASDPTLDNDGDALATGALYFNTTDDKLYVYNGTTWNAAALDNSQYLLVTGGAMTGAITTTSTFDGRNVSADGALLDTAVQEGDTTTAAMSFVVDEDNMVSDLATKVPTQQSTKAYVDTEVAAAIAGEMSFKGNYDASTNTPDLDTTPIATAVGDMYVVTVAGTFFTTAVEAGDMLLSKQVTATLESHWSIVNRNIDSSAFATAAQGTTADAALARAGGAMTGTITNFTSTGIDDNADATSITIDSSENVGIGIASPTSKLDVNGSITIPDGEGYYFGSSTYRVEGKDDGASARIAFITANSERMRIDPAGNVGIGTSSPTAKLEVSGPSVSGFGQFVLKSDTAAQMTWFQNGTLQGNAYTDGSKMVLGSSTATPLVLRTNSVERMRIDSSGNVGIGTASPAFTLDVQDSVASGYSQSASFTNTDGTGFVNTQWKVGTASSTIRYAPGVFFKIGPDSSDTTTPLVFSTNNATERMRIDSSGNVGIGHTNPSQLLHVLGGNAQFSNGNVQFGGTGSPATSNPSLYRTGTDNLAISTSGAERMRIDSTGNVGIGTTSPDDKLDVAGAIRLTSDVSFNAALGGRLYKASNHGLAIQGVTGTENDVAIFNPGGTLLLVNPTGTNDTVLNKSSGNVGIGTSSPSYKLETKDGDMSLIKTMAASGGNTSNSLRFRVNNSANTAENATLSSISGETVDSWGGVLKFSTKTANGTPNDSVTERMRIDSTGNVGIGTTSPSQKLHVKGSATKQCLLESTGVSVYQTFACDGQLSADSGYVGYHTDKSMTLWTDNIKQMTITSTGNVGIGTDSPGGKLDVQGGRSFFSASSEQYGVGVKHVSTGGAVYFGATSSSSTPDAAISSAGGSTLMTLQNGGNVGIGTTSPTQALEVGDGAAQHRIRIVGSGSPGLEFNDSGTAIVLGGANTLDTYTSGVNRMRIDSSGNVGIGTTSPGVQLHLGSDGSSGYTNSRLLLSATQSTTRGAGMFTHNEQSDVEWFTGMPYNKSGAWAICSKTAQAAHADSVSDIANAAITVLSDGNVGIGTTSPQSSLQLGATAVIGQDVNSSYMGVNFTSTGINYINTNYATRIHSDQTTGVVKLQSAPSGTAGTAITWDTNMAINEGGDVLFSSDGNQNNVGTIINGYGVIRVTASAQPSAHLLRKGSDGEVVSFYRDSTQVGNISVTGSATAYNTSSDYRLKENVTPMTDSIDTLKLLKPCNFDWKVDGSNTDGFLAHELQEVIPGAAHGTKDAMKDEEYEVTPAIDAVLDDEGIELTPAVEAVMETRSVPDMQGIDQAKVVPLLTAALQDAITMIEDQNVLIKRLERRIGKLEGE